MLECSLKFLLTLKYRDIDNSMMFSKEPITLEKVLQELNYCDMRSYFERDKDDKASGIFVIGCTNQ